MIVERRPSRRPAGVAPGACQDFRCCCGSLLARVTPHGVQLKCRRCKRTVLVPIGGQRKSGRAPPEAYGMVDDHVVIRFRHERSDGTAWGDVRADQVTGAAVMARRALRQRQGG
jgi:hypothetical protein